MAQLRPLMCRSLLMTTAVERLLFVLLVTGSPAAADFDPEAYPPYETCALCHGLFGTSHTAKFPNLGGQKPAYVTKQIEAFLAGTRHNDGGQMATIVTELHPDAIPIVVQWFAGQDPPEPYPAADTGAGKAAFMELGCLDCHDNTMDGNSGVPFLSAQHPDYLIKQMSDFRDGKRDAIGAPDAHAASLLLTDDKIAEIAKYLGALERP